MNPYDDIPEASTSSNDIFVKSIELSVENNTKSNDDKVNLKRKRDLQSNKETKSVEDTLDKFQIYMLNDNKFEKASKLFMDVNFKSPKL
jgi:hypothetical protein